MSVPVLLVAGVVALLRRLHVAAHLDRSGRDRDGAAAAVDRDLRLRLEGDVVALERRRAADGERRGRAEALLDLAPGVDRARGERLVVDALHREVVLRA